MEPLFPIPDETHVAEAVRRLVAAADPLQIVVFGSVARGEAGPDSDSDSDRDLLVVMPAGTDRRAAAVAALRALSDLGVPKDVVVTTPEHLSLRRDSCWHIVATAVREGRTVYTHPLDERLRPERLDSVR